jgi:O-antigen/teichoic acid export membrane protein
MEENTNKTIFVNSIILYVRLFLVTVCSLFTTRFALKALGVVDFGLFSVLGSIITFMGIINTIMLSTSNRYITVAIGKGDGEEINKTFNVNLTVHVAIAILSIVIAIPLGTWYVLSFVNYDGDIINALWVYYITIVGSVISFVGVPYNGLLMAKEKFSVFCYMDIFVHILKLVVAYLLINFFTYKLIIYAITIAAATALPTFFYLWYCKQQYPEVVKVKRVKEKSRYREVLGFSAWVGYGAVATVGKTQGAALLVNFFFNTVMNAALGVANMVNQMIMTFSQNVAKPIAPQITKNYASGNMTRVDQLLIISTKFSYLVMLLVSLPFFINCEWILGLWLGEIPPYAVQFTILLIIDALIGSLDSGISNLIFADGNIKLYQIVINTVRFAAVILAFIFLKMGYEAVFLLYSYIFCNVVAFVCCIVILRYNLNYSIRDLVIKSYLPSLLVTVLCVAMVLLMPEMHPLLQFAIGLIVGCVIIAFVGLKREERGYILNMLTLLLKR